ncbi:MAG: DUF3999 family protein [Bacteroidota bacterium]
MKHLVRSLFCLFFLVVSSFSYGQMEEYKYKREVQNIANTWHKIELPKELFGKTSQDLTDIRIFGLTKSNDTIEAPYLLRLTAEKKSSKEVAFKLLNTSYNDKGHYFTFEIPTTEPINQIKLDFKQTNFDWRIRLEGSQDQKEWFTVLENYRILSIQNGQTDFQFTKLTFPSAKYRFFRVFVNSKAKAELNRASIAQNDITEGSFRKYSVKKLSVEENKQTKQTEIDVELQMPVRASHIKIHVSDTFDYYRNARITHVADSIKTDVGWKYNYRTLTSGTLNSIEKNEFQFSSRTVQKLKIYIDNNDNQPLAIDTIEVKGYIHELVARFTGPATYYLTYGNERATRPSYDIARFTDNIPEKPTALNLAAELAIDKDSPEVTAPLFKNKTWLWAIMVVIIAVLGWFSIQMMRKK